MATPSKTTNFVELFLTCGSWQQAQNIVDHLLEQKLIACAEFIPVKSKFWWKNKIEGGDEIKLIMHSIENYFDKIEAEVAKLHSYETFVLLAIPTTHVSEAAEQWLRDELKVTE
jgi:periplasmic divalent cation tolerance protein